MTSLLLHFFYIGLTSLGRACVVHPLAVPTLYHRFVGFMWDSMINLKTKHFFVLIPNKMSTIKINIYSSPLHAIYIYTKTVPLVPLFSIKLSLVDKNKDLDYNSL